MQPSWWFLRMSSWKYWFTVEWFIPDSHSNTTAIVRSSWPKNAQYQNNSRCPVESMAYEYIDILINPSQVDSFSEFSCSSSSSFTPEMIFGASVECVWLFLNLELFLFFFSFLGEFCMLLSMSPLKHRCKPEGGSLRAEISEAVMSLFSPTW